MDYTYEFVNVQPKKLFITVKYTKDGYPEVVRKLGINEFTKEGLKRTAEAGAYEAVNRWAAIDLAPETIEVADGPIAATYEAPPDVAPEIVETFDDEPEYDAFTQRLVAVQHQPEPNRIENKWEIVELNEEEKAGVVSYMNDAMRWERQGRLAQTDHWMAADTPNPTAEQLAYRQALRDVPSQAGFPKKIDWPTPPEA